MKIVHFFSVILTVADIVSDLVLAVDYCVTDNPLWCGLTWAFITLPVLLGLFLLSAYGIGIACCEDTYDKWRVWKGIRLCLESGPELILQPYIISQSDVDPSVISSRTNMIFNRISIKNLYPVWVIFILRLFIN